MATFAYGRVSTNDQTTENQRLEIERAGFKVDYWFIYSYIHNKADKFSQRFKSHLIVQINISKCNIVLL